MAVRRRDPRITGTGDLSATLRPARQPAHFNASVLDLSEQGILVLGGGLEVGESVGIEIAGPDFRLAGQAEVLHRDGHTTGLHIVSWSGPADRVIRALVAARLPETPRAEDPLHALSALILASSDDDAPGAFDGLPDGVAVISPIRDQSGRITDVLS